MFQTTYSSPIGLITLASDGSGLVGLWMEGQKYFKANMPEFVMTRDELPLFDTVRTWLDIYFAGKMPEIAELPLCPAGSEFRKEVWRVLCEIPYGQVITYGSIAQIVTGKLNKDSMSSQAIGGAVGHNPISIIIPCHRVVGSDGSLTGYAGGVHKKVKLLELEGADMSGLYVPAKSTAL